MSARGLGPACSLGTRRPSPSASMSLSPDDRVVAIPLYDTLLVVEVDACRGKTVKLPALAVGTDFAPDGRSIAVGHEDRSIAVID